MKSDYFSLERSARAQLSDDSLSGSEPLRHYRDVHAWVLMADPGAGKSKVFQTLADVEGGHYTPARDFVEMDWSVGKTGTLFIDGLDEVTAGSEPGSTVLGKIRSKLHQLGTPAFRISCREADWRGSADSAALQRLVGDKLFQELHLDPLTLSQTKDLVMHWRQCDEAAAIDFIRAAEQRDLDGLLDNPQTLRLLVEAIDGGCGDWPSSKTETYAMACAQLVQELNDEHQAAQLHTALPSEQLLEAAGYLSAVMLLSGNAAITRRASAGSVALTDLARGDGAPGNAVCQATLRTRLFRGPSPQFTPVHRTVAEYLGAQYLAARIQAGLPILRVLALMQGEDGGIVPALRGLHAWLAACLTGEARRTLIERDPLGLVLNGDVRSFTPGEKRQVLQALRDEASRYTYFRNQNWTSHPFGALATKDMEADFKALLESPDRSPPHLALLSCVLDALQHGEAMPALAAVLEGVVRDKAYGPALRKHALRTLVTSEGNWDVLVQLLADVHGGVVEDSDDELLGTLLKSLYPAHISSLELWQYFRTPKATQFLSSYWRFWHDLPENSARTEDVSALLDGLVSTGFQLKNQYDRFGSDEIVGELLVLGVTQNGAEIDVPKLYGWLSLGLGPHDYVPLRDPHKSALGQWLGKHSALYKALYEHGLKLFSAKGDDAWTADWRIRKRLYDAPVPEDADSWYLSLAHACSEGSLRKKLVSEAVYLVNQKKGPSEAIELLEKWSQNSSIDAAWVEKQLCTPYPLDADQQETLDLNQQYKERGVEESRQQVQFFREALPSFAKGPAHLGALMEVADAYFRDLHEKPPRSHLLELLNGDENWVQQALHGLRECLFRDDLPEATDIINAYAEGQRYNLMVPCLAAMALRDEENRKEALELPPSVLDVVVAFRLVHDINEMPLWFTRFLNQKPMVVATLLQHLVRLQIIAKSQDSRSLHALAYDPGYAVISKKITPDLVAKFPIKANKKLLQHLRFLIVSVLRFLDKDVQLSLIASKLKVESMDVAQRGYWLTAGILVEPELYLMDIQQFVAQNKARVAHVFALLSAVKERRSMRIMLTVSVQSFLIEVLASKSSLREVQTAGVSWVSPAMEMSRYTVDLINTLAANPDTTAQQALATLRQRPDLHHWYDALDRAAYDQRIARRKATFTPVSAQTVCATLANLKPANAADLWALTVGHLTQLIAEIRNGSTNDYRQYWAGDQHKLEDDCRDALLSDLKQRLALTGVSAEREGHYADAKRADIKVIAASHHIPIEIKGEWHPALWTAIVNQLTKQYGREPASDGYAIYVVFWFTGDMKAAPHDGGSKPKFPQELQQRLAATVPEPLRHKIAVLVVDCSRPAPKTAISR